MLLVHTYIPLCIVVRRALQVWRRFRPLKPTEIYDLASCSRILIFVLPILSSEKLQRLVNRVIAVICGRLRG